MTNADWKDVLEEHILEHYQQELFEMTLDELQSRCCKLGLNYTQLFKK